MKSRFTFVATGIIIGIFAIVLLSIASCKKNDNNSVPNGQFIGTYNGNDTTILGSAADVMTVTSGPANNGILVADQTQGVTFSGRVSGNNITFPYQAINYGYGTLTCVGYGNLSGGKTLYISLIDTSAGIPGTYSFGGTKQ